MTRRPIIRSAKLSDYRTVCELCAYHSHVTPPTRKQFSYRVEDSDSFLLVYDDTDRLSGLVLGKAVATGNKYSWCEKKLYVYIELLCGGAVPHCACVKKHLLVAMKRWVRGKNRGSKVEYIRLFEPKF